MFQKKFFVFLLSFFVVFDVFATLKSDTISWTVNKDSIGQSIAQIYTKSDTVVNAIPTFETDKNVISTDSVVYTPFKPSSNRALWLGAIIPGFGQVINKKYWKLPFVYGGFMGFAYVINWNNRHYQIYKNAYRDIIDNDPKTNSYIDILPEGYTLENFPGGMQTYKARLKTQQNQFRQDRDLSIILSVVYYGLVLLDAYVDAELYDFDISPNLVFDVAPTQIRNDINPKASALGLQCSIHF